MQGLSKETFKIWIPAGHFEVKPCWILNLYYKVMVQACKEQEIALQLKMEMLDSNHEDIYCFLGKDVKW